LNPLRPLLLILAWLLALLPGNALASIPRHTFTAPDPFAVSVPGATPIAAGEPVALLTLHLDGLYEGGVLVRQNPWSKFDPEGLSEEEVNRAMAEGIASVPQPFRAIAQAVGADKALASALVKADAKMTSQGKLSGMDKLALTAEGSAPAITAAVLAPAAAAGPLMLAKEGVAEATGLPIGFDDVAKLLKNADGIVKSAKETVEETQQLFRAVGPDELADIKKADAFRNPDGIENKYFSTTEAGANQYGEMAEKAFGDPPYTTVQTSIPKKDITTDMKAQVDRGIDTVVVPTQKLNKLDKPKVKEKKR
jgi:hypothetical protein